MMVLIGRTPWRLSLLPPRPRGPDSTAGPMSALPQSPSPARPITRRLMWVFSVSFNIFDKSCDCQRSYLLQVQIDVVAGDGGVGDEVKQLSDRHHRHAVLHKEVWGEKTRLLLEMNLSD